MPTKRDFRRLLLDAIFPWLAGMFAVHLGMAMLFRGGAWADMATSWPSAKLLVFGGLIALAGLASFVAYRQLLVAPLLDFRGWMVLGFLAAALTLFGAIIDGLATNNGLWLLLSGSAVAVLCVLRARRRRAEDENEAVDARQAIKDLHP